MLFSSENVLEKHLKLGVWIGSLLQYFIRNLEVHVALLQFLEGVKTASLLVDGKVVVVLIIVENLLAEPVSVRSGAEGGDAIVEKNHEAGGCLQEQRNAALLHSGVPGEEAL